MFDSLDNLEQDLRQFSDDSFRVPGGFKLGSSEVGKTLIKLAAGKPVDAQDGDGELLSDGAAVAKRREAAARFVSDVMLSSSSNYFTTLGVAPNADSAVIRDNFRRLMALVHPDAQPVGFPPDAASRVNQAYAVLSESGSRAAYAARELGVSPFGPVVFNAEPAARRSVASAPDGVDRRPTGRLGTWLQTFRARQTLLWVAALLLLPLGAAMVSFFSYAPPQQLVIAQHPTDISAERRTGTNSSQVSLSPAEAQIAETVTSQPAKPTEIAKPPSPPATRNIPKSAPPSAENVGQVSQFPLKLSFETSQPASRNEAPTAAVSPPPEAASAVVTPPPTASARRAIVAASADTTPARQLSPALAPVEPTRVPAPDASGAAPAAVQVAVQTPPAARAAIVERPEAANRVKPSDAEAMVVRFSNAYESGSISAFGQLFAPSMASRRQMLNDYERVFSATRQRTIKFNQLKHSVLGERLSTSGYALVTTTDQDNRIMTQRVFLEFEFGRDRGEPRIERLANYVIN